MLAHPRVAIASGLAAAAGAAFLLLGRLEGPVLLAVVLAVGARAGALAASGTPTAAAALARQIRVAPAWALIAVVMVLRAGSIELAAVRGAHAVSGPAALNGEVAMVLATWFAGLAGVFALLAALGPDGTAGDAPADRLELLGIGVQALVIVAGLGGAQVVDPIDLVPWVVTAVGVAVVAVVIGRIATRELLVRSSVPVAAAALILAMIGNAP